VTLSDELLFKPQFCQRVLERYISPADMTEFKKGISDRCDEGARYAVRQRQLAFEQIGQLLQEGLANRKPPFILQKTADQKTESDYRFAALTNLTLWLETNKVGFAVTRRPDVDAAIALLHQLKAREDKLKRELEMQISCLKPVLAFDWLYIDRSRWIIELIFWCSFGVLANTIIKLIRVGREGKYNANEFCLIFPKAILAPVLALVITALWASGLSESKINFTNLAYLLVLFFVLGFATENLYEKIVGLADLVVTSSATASQARIDAAARESRYTYTTTNITANDLPIARTLTDLESKLSKVTRAAFERGVVSRLAKDK